MATERALAEKKKLSKSQPRLVFDEPPHIFRVKSGQSLAHLKETQEFLPCTACSQEADRRQRPTSALPLPPRPLTGNRKRTKPLPPTQADLERLSRPKSVPPEQFSNNCNWNNFIKKRSRYGTTKPFLFSFNLKTNFLLSLSSDQDTLCPMSLDMWRRK